MIVISGLKQMCPLNILKLKTKMLLLMQVLSVLSMPVDSTSELLKHYEVYETIGSGNVP